MRTLALLTTLLLLALQAQAWTLQETADQVPDQPEAKDQGELWADDQDQAGDDDQDVAISFTGEERLTRAAKPGTGTYCYCTLKKYCNFPEKKSGSCKLYGRQRKLCCH